MITVSPELDTSLEEVLEIMNEQAYQNNASLQWLKAFSPVIKSKEVDECD